MVLSRTFDNLLFRQIVWHSCPVVTLSRKNKYLQGHEKGHVLVLCGRRDFLRTDIGCPGRQILAQSKEAFSTNKSCLKASRLPRVGGSWFLSPKRAYKLARVVRERSPVLVPNRHFCSCPRVSSHSIGLPQGSQLWFLCSPVCE